jgi:hypothetical protein
MDEAEDVCCASKRVQKRGSPDPLRCMRAAASLDRSHQTAKRSVTRVNDQAVKDRKKELDPNARLEKRSLGMISSGFAFA